MVTAQATETVRCAPDDLLQLVMDIERYQHVDDKIRPVHWARRQGNVTEFNCRPTLGGLPTPTPVIQLIELTPGERVDISLAPAPRNRIARAMADFHASFVCREVPGGTEVTRTLDFTFPAAVRWFYEPLLRGRLQREVAEELSRAKRHLEEGSVREP